MSESVLQKVILLLAIGLLLIAAEKISATSVGTGGWYYHSDNTLSNFGSINVDSTYVDAKGVPWSAQ